MMEPFALTAHFKDGKLELWGGVQDPLHSRKAAAEAANISVDQVTFHPMIMGGAFGRRLPGYCEIIGQVVQIAKQIPSRQTDLVTRGRGETRLLSAASLCALEGCPG